MQYKKLGNTDIDVSLICLGTMTYGQQVSEADAHEQLSYGVERGINFIDTAELYPVPPREETHGSTERYIGTWLKDQPRDKLIVATKVAGPSIALAYLREEESPRIRPSDIRFAVERSLKYLQTDYIDLYQVHWPDRNANFFGKLGYTHVENEDARSLEEALGTMHELVQEGKIRHVGLSNDTPWGTMKALEIADKAGYKRIVSVQNPYNLLNRSYEIGLAEVSIREQCGLLAYSPLAFGMLTGKYRNGAKPESARLTLFAHFQRYTNPLGVEATERYCQLAEASGISPTHLALAYVNSQPFVTSNIITATTMEQLKEDIDSLDVILPAEVLEQLEAIHLQIPNPCP